MTTAQTINTGQRVFFTLQTQDYRGTVQDIDEDDGTLTVKVDGWGIVFLDPWQVTAINTDAHRTLRVI